jgi:hypothetical protein
MVTGSVTISITELHKLKQTLQDSLLVINAWIENHEAEVPKPTKSQSTAMLGQCMFVNKKVLKERSIRTKEQLETCPERCSNKAACVKNGLSICKRHEKADISKLEDIIVGVQPEFTVVAEPLEMCIEEDEISPLTEGEYGKPKIDNTYTQLEREMQQCEDLEQLLEQTDKVLPCRIGIREICLVMYKGQYYVIDPLGECLGKISKEERIREIDMKMKTKEYFDVEGNIERLIGLDKQFLETFCLSYSTRYCQPE